MPGTREVSIWVLALLYLVNLAGNSIATLVFASGMLAPIVRTTGGLINETLVFNLGLLAVGVGVVLMGMGRLAPAEFGLSPRTLPLALSATAAIWLVAQAILAISSLAIGGTLAPNPLWARAGISAILGFLIGQLFGNALFEEIAYRGVLLPQLRLKLGRSLSLSPRGALLAALVASQLLFALVHIPNRLARGADAITLPMALLVPFVLGLLFAVLYLRTGNLWIAVGIHALLNAPTALFAAPIEAWLVIAGISTLLVAVWPRAASDDLLALSGVSREAGSAP